MGDPAPVGHPHSPAPRPFRMAAFGPDARRVATALVCLPLVYALVRHAPPWAFFAFIGAVVLLAQWEFTGLFADPRRRAPQTLAGFLGALCLLTAMQWPALFGLPAMHGLPAVYGLPAAHGLSATLAMTLTVLLCYQVTAAPRRRPPFMLLFGILYIGYMLGHFLWLRDRHDGAWLVLFVLLVTWAGDTAAYYTGKLWGARPLAPHISPHKTREGLLGGLIAAPIAAWFGHLLFLPSLTAWDCLALGLLLTILGLVGDLSESTLKRQAGVKDSGALIPGHGGMLDRLDSLLLTVPAFYYYMTFLKGP